MVTGVVAAPAKAANTAKGSAAKLALVSRTYAKAVELLDTPAATYLHSRGLYPTGGWDGLRTSILHYPGVGPRPALIAPIDGLDGSLVGLHRTYLDHGGSKLDVASPRLTLGQARGCAIRLGQVTNELVVCEGLEDGLTLYQEWGIPVWVAGGASFMPAMAIPGGITSLIIAADNDEAGDRAAYRTADALSTGGREISIARPSPGFKDFNDQLLGRTS